MNYSSRAQLCLFDYFARGDDVDDVTHLHARVFALFTRGESAFNFSPSHRRSRVENHRREKCSFSGGKGGGSCAAEKFRARVKFRDKREREKGGVTCHSFFERSIVEVIIWEGGEEFSGEWRVDFVKYGVSCY